MNNDTRAVGRQGETLAQVFLERQGYTIIARNYSTRCGELDFIALDKDVLCFIEVKMRRNADYGHPVEAITPHKQKKITRTASHFIKQHKCHNVDCRFDVVSIRHDATSGTHTIEIIRNAFEDDEVV